MCFRPTGTVREPSAPRRGARTRLVAGVLASALLGLAACAGGDQPQDVRWVGAPGRAGGRQAPAPSGAAPAPTDDAGAVAPSATAGDRPGRSPSSAPGQPSTQPSGPGATSGPRPPGSESFLARIPQFPPAPAPEKVSLPDGPSAPFLSRIPTSQKVAFLTIDDGWFQRADAVQLMRAAHVPVTLFLTINAIRNDPAYFKQLQGSGAVIEAHTVTHADLKGKSADFQRREICGSADQLGSVYGRRPVLFRPPFGDQDQTTLRMTRECGMKAAFFWKETVDKGVVRYQEGRTVNPGDIILMHFRPGFVEDFLAALQAIHDAGLTPALLEDYVA